MNTIDGTAALDDESLAQRAVSEADAFAELYERYVKPVHRFVRAQVPDEVTAEDLTAQIFIKAFASASTFRGDGSYRAWVFQIARNTIATWRASTRRVEILLGELPDDAAAESLPTPLLAEDDRDLVLETIHELPVAQQEVVRLHYWKELTIDEIAQLTRRSSGAVRQLLHRARAGLRKRLSGKDLSALAGATGASAIAIYSLARRRRNKR